MVSTIVYIRELITQYTMTDTDSVTRRIEKAEKELEAAKIELKYLKTESTLETWFLNILKSMSIGKSHIKITDSNSYSLHGSIDDGYLIYAGEVPDKFYKQYRLDIQSKPSNILEFHIRQL